MDFTIRPVTPDDWPQWHAMRRALYSGLGEEFDMAEMEIYANSPDKACLVVAVAGGSVHGFAELSLRNIVDGCLSSPVGYLEGIFIRKESRGAGMGRALMAAAEAWCRSHGCTEMATDSELHDIDAQQFHLHHGFAETYRVVQFTKKLD